MYILWKHVYTDQLSSLFAINVQWKNLKVLTRIPFWYICTNKKIMALLQRDLSVTNSWTKLVSSNIDKLHKNWMLVISVAVLPEACSTSQFGLGYVPCSVNIIYSVISTGLWQTRGGTLVIFMHYWMFMLCIRLYHYISIHVY